MKTIITVLSILLIVSCSRKEEQKIISERTTKENRAAYQAETVQKTILDNLKKELADSTEDSWQSAFWASQVLQFKEELLQTKLQEAFQYYDKASPEFQRALIQNVYTLFPEQFTEEIKIAIEKTDNSKIFAMCAKYLEAENNSENLLWKMKSKFPNWENDPILFMLSDDLTVKSVENPPLVDLLTNPFGENTFIIYSFQRKNRDYKGITIIKNQQGKFVREKNGDLFAIPHFARAVTNLPPYITNGNTPQGIFSFQGFDVSSNSFIGPTTNIQIVMPFEANPEKYFKDEKLNADWNKEMYENMLPENWKNYFPIYEAYYAGKAGRTEIIAHGTTINPDYYKEKIYYPYTPSLGCLTASETWSEETGELLESDQLKLVNKLKEINAVNGFFILIEIDDKQKDVAVADILKDILNAEN